MPEKFVTKSRKILIYFEVKNYQKKDDFPTLLHIYSRKIVAEGKSRALDQYWCERDGNRKKFFLTFLFPSFQFFMICFFSSCQKLYFFEKRFVSSRFVGVALLPPRVVNDFTNHQARWFAIFAIFYPLILKGHQQNLK